LVGLEFIFKHHDGNDIIIRNKNILKSGSKKMISGKGFPIENSVGAGDLTIIYNIVFPNSLDDKQKQIISTLLPKKREQ